MKKTKWKYFFFHSTYSNWCILFEYNTQELDDNYVKPDAPHQYAIFDSNCERKWMEPLKGHDGGKNEKGEG